MPQTSAAAKVTNITTIAVVVTAVSNAWLGSPIDRADHVARGRRGIDRDQHIENSNNSSRCRKIRRCDTLFETLPSDTKQKYIKVQTGDVTMNVQVNQGVVGDTAKLMMHRLIARQIRRDPSLLDRARVAQAKVAEHFGEQPFVREWNELLKLPPAKLVAKLISRDSEMFRLRSSSPFGLTEGVDFSDYDLRIRIGRAARRVAERGFARHLDKLTYADFR